MKKDYSELVVDPRAWGKGNEGHHEKQMPSTRSSDEAMGGLQKERKLAYKEHKEAVWGEADRKPYSPRETRCLLTF